MKKEAIYKIGLTLVCASILAACGSSGSDDGPTPSPSPTPVVPDEKPDEGGVDVGEGEGREYEEQDTVKDAGYLQGAQNYVKYNSNFEPDTPNVGVYKGARQRFETPLHWSLDTIVIGWSQPKSGEGLRQIYLEDFDFTGNTVPVVVSPAAHTTAALLRNIYVTDKKDADDDLKAARDDVKNAKDAWDADPTNATLEAAYNTAVTDLGVPATASTPATGAILDHDDAMQAARDADKIEAEDSLDDAQAAADAARAAYVPGTPTSSAYGVIYGGYNKLDYSAGRYTLTALNAGALETDILDIWADTTVSTTGRNGGEQETKTEFTGLQPGVAVIYTQGQNNYTNSANYRGIDKENGNLTYKSGYVINHDREDTVAETYGHRSFVRDDRETADEAKNLPLVNEIVRPDFTAGFPHIGYEGDTLSHVQYGRVTSFLHNKRDGEGTVAEPLVSFRQGKFLSNETRIASWGKFGMNADRTKEDTYFYRGIGASTKDQIDSLGLKEIKATYKGHAVTYGLDHNLQAYGGAIPNAVGNSLHFISGTHVIANVDFAAKELTGGRLYNRWLDKTGVKGDDLAAWQKAKVIDDSLVNFSGKLVGNSVYGDAKKTYGAQDAGKFVGTFYGADAKELGGNIYSEEKGAKSWGAVFGAVTKPIVIPDESSIGPGPEKKK